MSIGIIRGTLQLKGRTVPLARDAECGVVSGFEMVQGSLPKPVTVNTTQAFLVVSGHFGVLHEQGG